MLLALTSAREALLPASNGMKLRSLVGWGIVIYAVLFLVWSGLAMYDFGGTIFSRGIVLLTLIAATAIATRSLRIYSESEIAPYAFGWVLVAALLDSVFAVPAAGWAIYSDWNLWLGYAVLLAVPFVVIALSKKNPS